MSIEAILNAANICLNSFALSGERKRAELNLENEVTGNNNKDVYLLLAQILALEDRNICSDAARQLVLGLLHDWIQKWWNSLTIDDHVYIRQSILDLLIRTNLTSMKPMRIKLSVIIATIAKRQFPQYWSEFVSDLCAIWTNQNATLDQQEVIIMTFEILITDCIDPDFSNLLPSLRKSDILAGIKPKLSLILQLCNQFLGHCYNEYLTLYTTNNNNIQNIQNNNIVNTIKSILKLIYAITIYIKADELYRIQPDLFNLINLIATPSSVIFLEEVVNILSACTMCKLSNFDTFYTLLQRICTYRLYTPLTSEYNPYEENEWLGILDTYAHCIINLLYYNIPFMISPVFQQPSSGTGIVSTEQGDLRRTYFSQLLTSVAGFSSLRLAYDLLPCWVTVCSSSIVMLYVCMYVYMYVCIYMSCILLCISLRGVILSILV